MGLTPKLASSRLVAAAQGADQHVRQAEHDEVHRADHSEQREPVASARLSARARLHAHRQPFARCRALGRAAVLRAPPGLAGPGVSAPGSAACWLTSPLCAGGVVVEAAGPVVLLEAGESFFNG